MAKWLNLLKELLSAVYSYVLHVSDLEVGLIVKIPNPCFLCLGVLKIILLIKILWPWVQNQVIYITQHLVLAHISNAE